MNDDKPTKLTDSELEILKILWEKGPAAVKLVNEIQNEKREVGYTTTLKIMQIMADKKVLRREKRGKCHVYTPSIEREKTQGQLIDTLLHNAFGGSAAKMVMQTLGNYKASEDEIREIREFLDSIEKGDKL